MVMECHRLLGHLSYQIFSVIQPDLRNKLRNDLRKKLEKKNTDVRDEDSAIKNTSKLTVKIRSFGKHEGKREYRDRASSDDLKRFLEKYGVTKFMIKMVVTISTNHLSTSDYEGIVKVVKQIPPM